MDLAPRKGHAMNDFEAYMEQEFEYLYRAHQKLLTEGAPSLSESEGESAWAYALMEQAWDASRSRVRSNFRRTADWLAACGKEPSPEALSLQIACHLEEMAEFIETIRCTNENIEDWLYRAVRSLEEASNYVKSQPSVKLKINRDENALDALCDMEVTGNGVAYLAGWNKEGADQAVLASNKAKLLEGKPVILPSGKIGKPEGWQPPDLSKFT